MDDHENKKEKLCESWKPYKYEGHSRLEPQSEDSGKTLQCALDVRRPAPTDGDFAL